MAENFDLIFGQNASQQYAWSDNDYQKGWETIGNIPPTAAQFDALQRRSDTKLKELNDELTPLVNADTADSRQPSTIYAVGDMRCYESLPYGWYLECTTAGTTSASELVLPTPIVEGDTVTDGTVTWTIHKISSADGMPIGAIIAYGGNGAIPSGYLLCDGAAYSRTALPDLFATIGTDYGSGDGSTTFNVPDSNQAKRFLQGDTVAGQTKSAGLPNIRGYLAANHLGSIPSSIVLPKDEGAIRYGINTAALRNDYDISLTSLSGAKTYADADLDASRSNPIYGNSTTVQPDALTTRYIIKAFDGQTADSALIDITQFENELGGKADRSLSNLTDAGKSFSFPSTTYVDISSQITLEADLYYTAPADGFVVLHGIFNPSSQYANTPSFYASVGNSVESRTDSNQGHHAIFIPVSKGQTVRIGVFGNTIEFARFVYAQGEVPV